MTETCESCYWWKEILDDPTTPAGVRFGKCVKRSPVRDSYSGWPIVEHSEGCGEFKEKKNDR